MSLAQSILDFWFDKQNKSRWFVKNDEFDSTIKSNFLTAYESACQDEYQDWKDNAESLLALIILFDQFPRNMFRNTAQAFETDARAVALTRHAIKQGFDMELTEEQRIFLYMPLMHSEKQDDQTLSVQCYEKLGKADNLDYAIRHKDIIDRFQRYPHRNEILGRDSTNEEIAFLQQPGSSF